MSSTTNGDWVENRKYVIEWLKRIDIKLKENETKVDAVISGINTKIDGLLDEVNAIVVDIKVEQAIAKQKEGRRAIIYGAIAGGIVTLLVSLLLYYIQPKLSGETGHKSETENVINE